MPTLSDNEKLELLAERSTIPEREPFHLPDDWRADKPQVPCRLCGWAGVWSNLTSALGRRPDTEPPLKTADLEQSASDGHLCCAVLLALGQKFVDHDSTDVKDIYVSWSSDKEAHAPPGVKVYAGHPLSEPWSEETSEWAKTQFEDCTLNHDCSTAFKSTRRVLPTRLVYIPDDFEAHGVRLIQHTESLPQDSRYTALSHCWGEPTGQECLTTVENVAHHSTEGINWAKVPQTFRDAIQYTRRLGLEYIWIDSLCILQKDATDWERESMRMLDYYSNAYITLGSTFATDCNGGFFSERRVRASRLYLFDMVYRGTRLPVYGRPFHDEETLLTRAENYDDRGRAMFNSPFNLFKRAWTFQERLVSPRLLLFTEHQLIFECYDGQRPHETNVTARETLKRKYRRVLASSGVESSEASWTNLVSSFTVLRLSYVTDKLPAFSAVAQQYLASQNPQSQAPEDGYLCGLRRRHIHCDLLWFAINYYIGYGGVGLDSDAACFGKTYLAPTWSWASVPRPTRYEDTRTIMGAGRGAGRSTVKLLEDHLAFTGAGPFGRVLEGSYIVVRGPVLDCYLADWTPGKNLGVSILGQFVWIKHEGEPHPLRDKLRIRPDFPRGYEFLESSGDIPLCLLLCWVDDENYQAGLLVLHKNSRNGRYYRVGVCFCFHGRWFESWPILKHFFQDAPQRVLEIE